MNITYLELPTKDLIAQRDFYSQVLELLVNLSATRLEVRVGKTTLAADAQPRHSGKVIACTSEGESRWQGLGNKRCAVRDRKRLTVTYAKQE